jgi:hypothetical protein
MLVITREKPITMDQHETISRRPPVHTFLLYFGIIASLLFNVVYFSIGSISPHYDMMRQPISNLELLPYGWIQSVNFFVFGLSSWAFGVVLRTELKSGVIAVVLPFYHALTGFGLILAGVFIHDPVHTAVLSAAFLAALISFVLFAVYFSDKPQWRRWTTYTIVSVVLMILFAWRFMYADRHNFPYAGVFERLVVVTRLVWIVLFTLKLLDGRRLEPAK